MSNSIISKQSSRSRFTLRNEDADINNNEEDDNNEELSQLARSLIDDYQNENNRGI